MAKQTTISHVFSMKKSCAPSISSSAEKALPSTAKLVSEDSRIQAFYDSLNPSEKLAHVIAIEKLGTSYDVSRTHGFLRWSKANPA